MAGIRRAVVTLLAALIAGGSPAFSQGTIEELEEKYPWRRDALRNLRELRLKEKAAAVKAILPEVEDPEAAWLARGCLFQKQGKVRYTREEIVFLNAGEKIAGHRGLAVPAGSKAAVNVIHDGGAAIDQVVHFVLGPHFDPESNTGYAYLRRASAWGAIRIEQLFHWAIPQEYPQGIGALHACTFLSDGGVLRSRLILRVSKPSPPAGASDASGPQDLKGPVDAVQSDPELP